MLYDDAYFVKYDAAKANATTTIPAQQLEAENPSAAPNVISTSVTNAMVEIDKASTVSYFLLLQ